MAPGAAGNGEAPRRVPEREDPSLVLQGVGIFLAPTVFFAHLQIGYVLVPWACAARQPGSMHAVAIAAIVLSLAGTLAARRVWRRAGRSARDDGSALARARFLGAVGCGMSAAFTLILVMQAMAGFVISPCQ
jgi:hypothetical protein